jgi:CRP/FNR family transcriptional regulator
VRSVSEEEPVLREGDTASYVCVLLTGSVRVFHSSDEGGEVTVMLRRAPALFGESHLAGDAVVENVSALEESRVVMIPLSAMHHFLAESPASAVRVLLDISQRMAIAAYQQKSLAFHSVTVRLANYLVDYAEWRRPRTGLQILPLSQDQMAAAVSATRRSVCKRMSAWQEEGILSRRGDGYIVRDLDALRSYADPCRMPLSGTQLPIAA